jgi:Flp pilus assembly protein TadG
MPHSSRNSARRPSRNGPASRERGRLVKWLLRDRSRGQALVELALITPLMIVLLAAAIDLGRLFYSGITVTNAAREGAIEASYNPTSFQAGLPCNAATNRVMCRAVNEAASSFVKVAVADVSMTCTPACATGLGNKVHVTVVGHFSLMTPLLSVFMGGTDVTLSSTASAQIVTPPITGTPSTPMPTPSPSPTDTPTPSPSGSVAPTGSPTPVPSPVCHEPTSFFSVTPSSGFRYKNASHPGTTFSFTSGATDMNEPLCNPIWSWNFGDGAGTSSLINPLYVYHTANTSPGFEVTLTVSNDAGEDSYNVILPVNN